MMTVIAALVGVILGWWLFSGRVRNLETAINAAESQVRQQVKNLETAINAAESQVKEYVSIQNEQLASLSLQLGQLSGSVADLPTSPPDRTEPAQQNARDNMRESWARIRSRLEEIAANPEIDGRTRARYDRIDRRRAGELVNALHNDGRLGADTELYRRAEGSWQRFRTGRATPSASEVQTMQQLAARLPPAGGHQ